PPVYLGSGDIEGVVLDQVSELMRNSWIEGAGSGRYEFKTQGWGLQDVIAEADLNATFALKDGRFPRVVLTSKSGSLRMQSCEGKLRLKEGYCSLEDAKLTATDVIYKVSGPASPSGALKLKMVNEGALQHEVSGTLTQTRVSQLATTSAPASLKP